jgi:hypothetical protein
MSGAESEVSRKEKALGVTYSQRAKRPPCRHGNIGSQSCRADRQRQFVVSRHEPSLVRGVQCQYQESRLLRASTERRKHGVGDFAGSDTAFFSNFAAFFSNSAASITAPTIEPSPHSFDSFRLVAVRRISASGVTRPLIVAVEGWRFAGVIRSVALETFSGSYWLSLLLCSLIA